MDEVCSVQDCKKIVSESRQPVHFMVLSEPRQLTLGVLAGLDLRGENRLFYRYCAADNLKRLFVAERFKRLLGAAASPREQVLYFFDQSGLEHRTRSRV